jgi:hypothetical protein
MNYELHGDTGTRLHRIWKSMKCRCNLSTHPTYKNYGARGIIVCQEWNESYSAFREWSLSNGYSEGLELDRIDVNGDYCPENCRWISHHEQTLNRRDTLYIEIDGETIRLRDFCIKNGINVNSVNDWRYRGVLEEKLSEILNTPVRVIGGKKVGGRK